MSFLSNFLATNTSDERQEETNEPNTRSRAAARHALALAVRADRSRSPAHPTMATPEQLAAIREELRAELRREIRAETTATAAAIPDAIRRKPEIPQFDREHIDVWIRRTEHAFIRALITSPQEKFAFLEAKFPCSFNPRINEFLWGDATATRYNEFLQYLRDEYGPTKQQKASVFIEGFKRDGRKPSQYAAALDEKTKGVTLDDIKKEMLIREMPVETRRMLQERIEGLSFQEAAKIADSYFDKDGRPRFQTTSINMIQDTEVETEVTDGINAINNRPTQKGWHAQTATKQHAKTTPTKEWHAQTGASPKGWHAQTAASQKGWHAQTARKQKAWTQTNPDVCVYHERFGEKAQKCEVHCKFHPGNGSAGAK